VGNWLIHIQPVDYPWQANSAMDYRLFIRIGDEATSGERCVLARHLSELRVMTEAGSRYWEGSGYAMG